MPKAGFATVCGKCYNCVKRKITDWATRLHFEEYYSTSRPLFITLTYNDANLKKPFRTARYASLCKRDVQTFLKRLRKRHKKRPGSTDNIRYLCVGEYGTKNHRPHYHLLLFNSYERDVIDSWKKGDEPIGEIYFGDVTGRSIAYVCGYALAREGNRVHVTRHHLVPEFHLYSNGLGKVYATRTAAIHHNRRVQNGDPAHYVMVDGVKRPMPRYYTDRIYTPQNKQLLKLQLQAISDAKEQILITTKQLHDAHSESTRKLTQRRKSTVA